MAGPLYLKTAKEILLILDGHEGVHHVVNRRQEFCRRLKTPLVGDHIDHLLVKRDTGDTVT